MRVLQQRRLGKVERRQITSKAYVFIEIRLMQPKGKFHDLRISSPSLRPEKKSHIRKFGTAVGVVGSGYQRSLLVNETAAYNFSTPPNLRGTTDFSCLRPVLN